jgi:lipoyl(octanoyl) transferase
VALTTGIGEAGVAGGLRAFDVRRLGRVDYGAALELQARLVEERRRGEIGDSLLLLEHPPVITLGVKTRGKPTNIVASPEALAAEGVAVFETGRGGDITYHGPGQLVGYPILDLRPDRCDVHRYVRDLEEVLIVALREFGIEGARVTGLTGVWVGPAGREEKIAAIGVRISRWITSHGFALNVATDLRHFRLIVPCGIADRGVTSIERVLGRPVAMAGVEDAIVRGFAAVFNSDRRTRSAG